MDDSLRQAELDWQNQLKSLEEVDKWEKLGNNNVPVEFKGELDNLLAHFSGLNRLPIIKLLNSFKWDVSILAMFFSIISTIPVESYALNLVFLLDELTKNNIAALAINIMSKLKDVHVMELLARVQRADVHLLMQVSRHLSTADLLNLTECVEQLSVQEVIDMLKRCDEPLAKGCQLCRMKRLQALEFRMINGQVPNKTIPVPGALAIYDKAQMWCADDEKGLTFELQDDRILWMNQPVDLVQICDKCLLDVNQSITNSGRFDSLYNIDASVRTDALWQLRQREKQLAEIIWRIAKERKQRRAREFALAALRAQRVGLKREKDEAERRLMEEKRVAALAAERQAKDALLVAARRTEEKWRTEDETAQSKRLDKRLNFSEVQIHMGFNQDRPAPKERQHSRTWRLNLFDEDGLAITEEGANMAFGQHVEVDHGELPKILLWKSEADRRTEAYRKRQEELKEEQREKEIKELHALKDYVNERSKVFRRRYKKMEHLAQQEERDRVERRKGERALRRQARFEEYIACEREDMMEEDRRGYQLRFFDWERRQMAREREDMFNAHLEQTEVDRFWGLEKYEMQMNAEERRLKAAYERKVIELNLKMASMKATVASFKSSALLSKGASKLQRLKWEDSAAAQSPLRRDDPDLYMSGVMLRSAETERREALIKKLKAEEVRGKLKYRISPGYS